MSARLALATVLCLAALGMPLAKAAAQAPLWTLESGSKVGFVARQAGAPVEGVFERFTAEIRFDPAAPETGRAVVTIEIDSVNSESQDRDNTIRSASLFDVATWATARFEAAGFSAAADGAYGAQGKLTLRDTTHDIVLPFTLTIADHPDDAGALRAHAVGELEINRLDYGVGQGLWTDTSVVADAVTVVIDILAKRAKE